ncbi:MAG: KipI family sensor histidine kinase inhibitor [Kangiellaceae bacterium]|jgi:KipI family sensor histidine kinase inhibitor
MLDTLSAKNFQQRNKLIQLDDSTYAERVSETSVIVRVGQMSNSDAINCVLTLQDRNLVIRRCLSHIVAKEPSWLLDHVVSYDSLLLVFDSLETSFDSVLSWLNNTISQVNNVQIELTTTLQGQIHEIDVCYTLSDDSHPNDMALVETSTGLIEGEIIDLHKISEYQVFAVGFMPNFAYLGVLSPQLKVSRLARPRHTVPAGAVAIADNQTAVYPSASPGGWHIIGYTAFSFCADIVKAIGPNDRVKFNSIDEQTYYQQLQRAGK